MLVSSSQVERKVVILALGRNNFTVQKNCLFLQGYNVLS